MSKKKPRAVMSVTLREAIKQSEQRYVMDAAALIAKPMLGLTANEFSDGQFKELQKTLEVYAGTVTYSVRIGAVKELNEFFDSFFQSRFGKVCRLERVFEGDEIDILLLKALQGGTDASLYAQSQSDRAERFGMSINAMQDRIHGLEDGKEILGHHVRISIDGRGRVAYDNTIHPVFLTLNLKEVYMLTIKLRQAMVGTPFEKMADDVSNDIYAQLSDYAKNVLAPHIQQSGISFDEQQSDAQTAYRHEERDVVFFLKSQQHCMLQMIDGATYRGRIVSRGNIIAMLTDNGEELTLPDDRSAYTLTSEE